MTFYFVGGEDHDFTKIGTCSVDTATTAARRTGNARCSLKVGPSAATTDGWQGALSSAQSAFWLTARYYIAATPTTTNAEVCSLLDGSVRRLTLRISSGVYQLVKRNSVGTVTTLVTSSVAISALTVQKLDIQVNYAVSGTVNIYLDGSLIISYSGDVTTDSATTLSSFVLGNTGSAVHWSEGICTDGDTRALNLVTMAPNANGNTFSFDTGSYANINETTIDDTGLITSATAGQLAQFTVGSSGITGTPAIRALCISARAQKGGTGPQNCKMSVRTGGVDQLSSLLSLPAAMNRTAYVFETNPGTSGPWAYNDLTAAGFNIGIRSET
jgi:hypothetical protein